MAYTRGRHVPAAAIEHMDDGEIGPVARPIVAASLRNGPEAYICNKATIERNMEAYELFLLLDMLKLPIEIEIEAEEWAKLAPDLRRHFRPVSG